MPILGLFTWMIPLFVLERIIPIQFYGFILNIPLIIWCTFISTIIVSCTFLIANFIDKHEENLFILNEIKNRISLKNIYMGSCHCFGIMVFCGFCSFVFCVSPSLYLCALFWFIYEINKNDIKIDEDALEIRQYLYQFCFSLFDEIESEMFQQNILKYKLRWKAKEKIKYLKQFAYHILSVLLTVKHISDGHIIYPHILKKYIQCLQNSLVQCVFHFI